MSEQIRRLVRENALAYAVQSTKGADPDTILTAAEKFYTFLSNSVTGDSETQDKVTVTPRREVTKDREDIGKRLSDRAESAEEDASRD